MLLVTTLMGSQMQQRNIKLIKEPISYSSKIASAFKFSMKSGEISPNLAVIRYRNAKLKKKVILKSF